MTVRRIKIPGIQRVLILLTHILVVLQEKKIMKQITTQSTYTFWTALLYLFTPEDSRDTTYRVPLSPVIRAFPASMKHLKTALWVIVALGVSLLLSQLQ
jgi:hypothetical protein